LVSAKNLTGNLAALTFKGQLRPKPIPGSQMPMMMGFRGPGAPLSLSSYAMRPQMEGMDRLDERLGFRAGSCHHGRAVLAGTSLDFF